MDMTTTTTHLMGDLSNKIPVENNKDTEVDSNLEDHLVSLTKVPTPNAPESLVDLSIKIRFAALDAKNLATCKKTVQNSTDHHKRTIQDPRSLRIILTTYSGPDVQPHLQRTYPNQQMATNYDQALGAIKDSLSTANPLASLNL